MSRIPYLNHRSQIKEFSHPLHPVGTTRSPKDAFCIQGSMVDMRGIPRRKNSNFPFYSNCREGKRQENWQCSDKFNVSAWENRRFRVLMENHLQILSKSRFFELNFWQGEDWLGRVKLARRARLSPYFMSSLPGPLLPKLFFNLLLPERQDYFSLAWDILRTLRAKD